MSLKHELLIKRGFVSNNWQKRMNSFLKEQKIKLISGLKFSDSETINWTPAVIFLPYNKRLYLVWLPPVYCIFTVQ